MIKLTMTEAQAMEDMKKRGEVTIAILKDIQKLLLQLNDCITLLIHPMYEVNGGDDERE